MPDSFDPSAVDLMKTMLSRSTKPGHLYPMAMFSAPVMPPPKTLEKAVGERRLTNFTPVGISLAPELDVEAIIGPHADKVTQQAALAQAAFRGCTEVYIPLERACHDAKARTKDLVLP